MQTRSNSVLLPSQWIGGIVSCFGFVSSNRLSEELRYLHGELGGCTTAETNGFFSRVERMAQGVTYDNQRVAVNFFEGSSEISIRFKSALGNVSVWTYNFGEMLGEPYDSSDWVVGFGIYGGDYKKLMRAGNSHLFFELVESVLKSDRYSACWGGNAEDFQPYVLGFENLGDYKLKLEKFVTPMMLFDRNSLAKGIDLPDLEERVFRLTQVGADRYFCVSEEKLTLTDKVKFHEASKCFSKINLYRTWDVFSSVS